MPTSANNIHFIVNPVSGSQSAPFNLFGEFMSQSDAKTTLHVTKLHHSASDCVQDALSDEANLIVAYGGDGTITEVAVALHGHNVPMAIVPGGTANVIAHELDIPQNPQEALELIFHEEHEQHWLDAGRVNETHFLLRLSIGWEAELSQRPSVEDKSSWGILAYTQSALQALQDLDPIRYRLTLDDDRVEEVQGINCSICNIGNVGLYGVNIGMGISPHDGLLNVLILQNKNVQGVFDITQNVLASTLPLDLEERLLHFKAKKITVMPSEPQRMSYDGEVFEDTFPITIEVVSQYISIIVPKQ